MKTIDNKTYYTWSDYAKDIRATDWIKCDHVIGIYRGSLGMASHISNVKDVPMSIVGFQHRSKGDKSPYWIHNATEIEKLEPYSEGQTILIVDDIYDTGHTMNSVIEFVKKSRTKPSSMPNVLGYCLFGHESSDIVYTNEHDGSWIVFPWETLDESI
jgi:hypoxanthine phosphoribosyltransferase|tara:strand:+ start:2767 stop:3237 length:471 start_codon:yes stop_codon:yes gene_type:complete